MPFFSSPNLTALPHIRHGFFTREGGVSQGVYNSLNCAYGTGDNPAHVDKNYHIITRALGGIEGNYCKAHQIHSNIVVTATAPWKREAAPQADAIITNVSGLMLGITTADCLPILFADAQKPIIGAAHAGWKGAIGGIIEATLFAMKNLGAADIIAAIGPAIEQKSYEVGAEFYERFLQESPENSAFFVASSRQSYYQFNLKAYAKKRLQRAGIREINILANDTCFEENRFFSYRRTCQRGESAYGCQLSSIMLSSS